MERPVDTRVKRRGPFDAAKAENGRHRAQWREVLQAFYDTHVVALKKMALAIGVISLPGRGTNILLAGVPDNLGQEEEDTISFLKSIDGMTVGVRRLLIRSSLAPNSKADLFDPTRAEFAVFQTMYEAASRQKVINFREVFNTTKLQLYALGCMREVRIHAGQKSIVAPRPRTDLLTAVALRVDVVAAFSDFCRDKIDFPALLVRLDGLTPKLDFDHVEVGKMITIQLNYRRLSAFVQTYECVFLQIRLPAACISAFREASSIAAQRGIHFQGYVEKGDRLKEMKKAQDRFEYISKLFLPREIMDPLGKKPFAGKGRKGADGSNDNKNNKDTVPNVQGARLKGEKGESAAGSIPRNKVASAAEQQIAAFENAARLAEAQLLHGDTSGEEEEEEDNGSRPPRLQNEDGSFDDDNLDAVETSEMRDTQKRMKEEAEKRRLELEETDRRALEESLAASKRLFEVSIQKSVKAAQEKVLKKGGTPEEATRAGRERGRNLLSAVEHARGRTVSANGTRFVERPGKVKVDITPLEGEGGGEKKELEGYVWTLDQSTELGPFTSAAGHKAVLDTATGIVKAGADSWFAMRADGIDDPIRVKQEDPTATHKVTVRVAKKLIVITRFST